MSRVPSDKGGHTLRAHHGTHGSGRSNDSNSSPRRIAIGPAGGVRSRSPLADFRYWDKADMSYDCIGTRCWVELCGLATDAIQRVEGPVLCDVSVSLFAPIQTLDVRWPLRSSAVSYRISEPF